jgi:hypothetical protein
LNDTCLNALRELHARAAALGFADAEHFLFPWYGRNKKLDATRPMTLGGVPGAHCGARPGCPTSDSMAAIRR